MPVAVDSAAGSENQNNKAMDIKIIERLADITSLDTKRAFEKLCDFIIGFFDPEGKPVEGWEYGKDVNAEFQNAAYGIFKEYDSGINARGWADPLGGTFEAVLGRVDASRKGAFFTPEGICRLMAEITVEVGMGGKKTDCGAFGYRTIASDPTCGSGRNLLACAAKFIGQTREELPYFVGEDIDPLCVKMTAINLMAHSLPGEVICHNTLTEPDNCSFGYVVNEGMFPISGGLPTIRRFTDQKRFVVLRLRR